MTRQIKILFLAGVLLLIGSPYFVLAETLPENDPLCWTEAECRQAVKGYTPDNFIKGGVSGVCGEQLGYCVPAGQVQTKIKIGEASAFKNLGDYIQIVYRYLVGIAGLVAAVLIIRGGFQYITSAGDATKIAGAKESIGSALIGLLLVLGSYVILNTVNPELVNLKLPGVYMIRPALAAAWCADLPFTEAPDGKTSYPKVAAAVLKKATDLKSEDFTVQSTETKCGQEYYFPGGRGSTCRGRSCLGVGERENQACLLVGKTGRCVEGFLAGTIKIKRAEAVLRYSPDPLAYNLTAWAVCRDEKNEEYHYKAAVMSTRRPIASEEEKNTFTDGFALPNFKVHSRYGGSADEPCLEKAGYTEVGCYLTLGLINYALPTKIPPGHEAYYYVDRNRQRFDKENLNSAALFNCQQLAQISKGKEPPLYVEINVDENTFPP